MTHDTVDVNELLCLLEKKGAVSYFGEPVTQLDHALQTAALARSARVENSLVIAALLHDIGHLLHSFREDNTSEEIDARHEQIGADWLEKHFGHAVSEPVRLHVEAKRYLCTALPDYGGKLSASSLKSLTLQGGALSKEEARQFISLPFAMHSIDLRLWDDLAKVSGVAVAGLADYRDLLSSSFLSILTKS